MRIGPHEILGELGRGGMGVVFRVRTPAGGEAALKLLVKVDRGALDRFSRERRLLETLGEEQGFVGLLDAGVSPEGAWLLTTFVPGGTLRQRLAVGPLGIEETVTLGVELATALGHAHERGIVHRDVKPENILFTASGRALLADLGLAKHFDRSAPGASQSVGLTRDGIFKGTAGYVAPEQVEDAARAGPPADVFALGAVLHECLSGRPAFEATSMVEAIAKVSHGSVERIERPGVPPWLEAVLVRALAREPRDRFADGAALARALRTRAPKSARPGRLLVALVAGGALGALVLGAVLRPRDRPVQKAEAPPPRPAPPRATNVAAARDLVELGGEKARHGDIDGGIADLSKAIELDPGLAIAWVDRGSARRRKGDRDGAIADLTRGIELDPSRGSSWAVRGLARAAGRRDLAGAISDYSKAIELEPGFAPAWANRGGARFDQGDVDGAIADCSRAVELDPRMAQAWLNRAGARFLTRDMEGAIADSSRAIELDARMAAAWCCRGGARGKRGDLDGAIADCSRSIELEPGLALAWEHRGAAFFKKGDVDRAIADYSRVIEIGPGIAKAWSMRGSAFLKKGDMDRAIADCSRAIELDPRLAAGWTNRGLALLEKGDRERAIPDLERALALDPDGPGAARLRDQLEAAKRR